MNRYQIHSEDKSKPIMLSFEGPPIIVGEIEPSDDGDMPFTITVKLPKAITNQFQGPNGDEYLARFLGYKNANSMRRFVRRMKRRKERNRRERLKRGQT